MPLYTFVLDYDDGTYVSQRRAEDVDQAFADWANAIVLEETALGASLDVAKAFEDWEDYEPVPLKGLSSVWCATGSNDVGLALLNIIQTQD